MQQITDWLKKLGMSEYAERFVENKIDISVLPDLTEQHLKDLGIALGDRLKMLRAIRELGNVSVAVTALAAPAETEPGRRDEAERRQLTVMFTDLVGSTALSTKLDPEDLRSVIGAYHKCVAATVARFDGFVAKYMGDGVLIYFGYPQAHEDDAERAVRAGLALIEAVGKLQIEEPLQVRVGVATGLVVVGDLVGSGDAQERGVVGETPNVAARLQGLAAPNTIVIAEGTRRLIGDLFELEDLGAVDLKGIAGRVRAWVALGSSSVESRFEALHATGLTALVGREEELELLVRRWSRAKTGEGQVVLIAGEAGIGKSRLTAALLERLAGEPHMRLRYFCSPQHTDSALYPIIGQMERAAGIVRGDQTQVRTDKLDAVLARTSTSMQDAALLAEILSLPNDGRYPTLELSPQQRRQRTLEALTSQLAELARRTPVLMIFEDVHWIDPTSDEVLDRIISRICDLNVLLIVTFRPEFNPPWSGEGHVSLITLNRLAPCYCSDLVQHVTGNKELSGNVVDEIISRADGIPLFIEELTKAILEVGHSKAREQVATIPSSAPGVPSALHASLMARLDRLGPAKRAAQIGAAIGRQFSYELIAATTNWRDTELVDALERLTNSELLFREGVFPHATFLFKHSLVQDAAYGMLLRTARRDIHERIAKVLEETFPQTRETQPEILAHHYFQAGLVEPAIEWWDKAGQRAINGSAYNEAIAHLEKAIRLAGELTDGGRQRLLQLQTAYGYALLHARGQTAPHTAAAFSRARELAVESDDTAQRSSAYYGLWARSLIRAELTSMQEVADAFLTESQRLPGSPEAGIAHRLFGITCWYKGDYANVCMHLERALAAYDPERDRHLASSFGYDPRSSAILYLALVLWPLGEVDRAVCLADEGLYAALQGGHVPTITYAHLQMCLFAAVLGMPHRAAAHAETAVRLAQERGLPLWLAYGTCFLGWVRWWTGDREGEATMRKGLALLREMDVRHVAPLLGTLLAEVEVDAGYLEIGLATVEAQLTMIEQTDERWFHAEVHRIHAELLLRREPADNECVEAAFKNAIIIARDQKTRTFELRASTSLARLWRDQGKRTEARDLLAPIYNRFTEGFGTPILKGAKALLDELA